MRTRILALLLDLLLILIALHMVMLIKGNNLLLFWQKNYAGFLIILLLYQILSFVFDKYNFKKRYKLNKVLLPILYTNLVFSGISAIIIALGYISVSWALLFGTVIIVTVIEFLAGWLITDLRHIRQKKIYHNDANTTLSKDLIYFPGNSINTNRPVSDADASKPSEDEKLLLEKTIINEVGSEIFAYLRIHISFSEHTYVMKTGSYVNVQSLPSNHIKSVVNLKNINNISHINKLFTSVNQKLPLGGLFIGMGETHCHRKKIFYSRYKVFAGSIFYFFDYLIHRVAPKLSLTQKLYFSIYQSRYRVLSRAEILGRAYYCGFKIRDEQMINGRLVFLAEKTGMPVIDIEPTYGPFISLKRVGKNGSIINVYKLRTMFPYSEYLQSYIFQRNYLADCGKFNDDYRINTFGKYARKLWLDELPMIANLIRGDLKIVGVRPLSEHYYSLYPKELQDERIQTKPGLIPPFYSDMPKSFDEIVESELRYIRAFKKKPLATDCKYFYKALYNILVRRARSK